MLHCVFTNKIKFTVSLKQRLMKNWLSKLYKLKKKWFKHLRLVFNLCGTAVGFKALPCLIESNSCSLGVGCLFRGFNLRSDALNKQLSHQNYLSSITKQKKKKIKFHKGFKNNYQLKKIALTTLQG